MGNNVMSLELSDVAAFYGTSQILHSVDLKLTGTGSVALLGRNGVGKSTLFKSIMSAGPRITGTICWGGVNIESWTSEMRSRSGLVLVPEDRRIFTKLTVVENIQLGRFNNPEKCKSLSLSQIWEFFPLLQPLRTRLGYQLSGGEQQLVALARGIYGVPRLLLLDEPAEGLAPVVVRDLVSYINHLRDSLGLTLFISEQNISFVRECTDFVHVIDMGRIVFSGTWNDFDMNWESIAPHLTV